MQLSATSRRKAIEASNRIFIGIRRNGRAFAKMTNVRIAAQVLPIKIFENDQVDVVATEYIGPKFNSIYAGHLNSKNLKPLTAAHPTRCRMPPSRCSRLHVNAPDRFPWNHLHRSRSRDAFRSGA